MKKTKETKKHDRLLTYLADSKFSFIEFHQSSTPALYTLERLKYMIRIPQKKSSEKRIF